MSMNLERRRHNREIVVRPCKVRDRRNILFSPGETHDISSSGALLRVESGRPFAPGDELDIAIAWNHEPVIAGEGLVRARVRRVTPIDFHHQALALEFLRSEQVVLAPAA